MFQVLSIRAFITIAFFVENNISSLSGVNRIKKLRVLIAESNPISVLKEPDFCVSEHFL